MAEPGLQIRCQRCGDQMEMKDPAPGQAWPPQQFWKCGRCGRNFWTSYVNDPNNPPAPKQQPPPATPGATTPAPTAQAPAAAAPVTPTTPAS